MSGTAARLDAALRAAGLAIDGVTVGDPANKATWTVQPASLQGAAQPTIDAFNPTDPTYVQADADAAVDAHLDTTVAGDGVSVLFEQLPAIVADLNAGRYDRGVWAQKFRGRLKVVHRAKAGV